MASRSDRALFVEWRRRLSPAEQQARYQQWRRRWPWTDEQFAAALEADAATGELTCPFLAARYRYWAGQCRKGRVSMATVRHTLPRLITSCAYCAKKALYRIGIEGRCRAHRDLPSAGKTWNRKRHEEQNYACSMDRKKADYRDLARKSQSGAARRRPK